MSDVDLCGETFTLNPVGTYDWEMMEFAASAQDGADSDLLAGIAVVMDFLKAVIPADDWARFRATARKNKAQVERDLMPIVFAAFTQQAERPTGPPSVSSAGRKKTKRKSAADSSSRVIRRLEKQGRPDLALMVTMAEKSRSVA